MDFDEILVGDREKVRIRIVDYEPAWPPRFERESERLRSALGATALSIEHIGATAVPGPRGQANRRCAGGRADPEDEALVPSLEGAG